MSIEQVSQWVPAPSTTRGSSTKIGASADGSSISYGAGRSAVIRSLGDGPSTMFGHAAAVNVAKISPTGQYCASGDAVGTVRVWDTLNQSVKLESRPLARITDCAFDGEGKRIVVVGEGRERFGATFSLDTGASIGEISGHAKTINAVAMRPSRPFRAVTASDDFSVCLLNGVPFKFASQSRLHSRFVQTVDYSRNGALFVSAGSDGRAFLYDGLSGEQAGAFSDSGTTAHKGTIFAASFSADSNTLVTSSADATCKLWDVETRTILQTWQFAGNSLQSQQVGNVWAGDRIVSLGFSGVLNVLDARSARPSSTLFGHQAGITALAQSTASQTFFSGDSSGCIRSFSLEGVCGQVKGAGHTGLVVDIVPVGSSGALASTSFDDSIKLLDESTGFESSSLSTGAVPKGLSSTSQGLLALATANDVQIIENGAKVATLPVTYTPTCVAITLAGAVVAVGAEDLKVHLYDSKDKNVALLGSLELRNPATAMAFSPDDSKLAVGDSTGKVLLYDVDTRTLLLSRWVHQTGRVQAVRWNSQGTHLAAGSLDESIRVYSLANPGDVASAKNAHRGGVATLLWAADGVLVSGGADGALKTFEVKL